jgi:glycolate oxidase FAD binding subunit
MSTREGLATALQSVVGQEYLLTSEAAYAIDGVCPALVVLPADADQVAAVLRLASEHQATVFPRGGGSDMALGHTPARVDLVLGLQRLQQQLAYEPADMTTTVQAGLRLAELQQRLGQGGQFLALDPPAAATATVGGVVATNRSGPRRLLYGTARDLLLGITVLTVDGTRTKAGGRVVKNVTGYDLNKLYIGSLGTLAVIVELTFKLHPLPPGEGTLMLGCAHHADLLPLLHTLMQLPLRVNSLELCNAAAVTLVDGAVLPVPPSAYALIVRVEGTPEVVQRQQQRVLEALQQLSLTRAPVVHVCSPAEQAQLWSRIEEFACAPSAGGASGVMSKVSLCMSDLPAFLREVEEMSAPSGTTWPVLAHAGSGIAYVSMPPDDTMRLVQNMRLLDTCVSRLRGHRVMERAPVAVKQHCQVWGTPGDDFALMRAIKTSFDPHGRLNPGRFIGGL